MLKKYQQANLYFSIGILILLIGIFHLSYKSSAYISILRIISSFMSILAILLKMTVIRHGKIIPFHKLFIIAACTFISFDTPKIAIIIFVWTMCAYVIVQAALFVINYFVDKDEHLKGITISFILAIATIISCLFIVLDPINKGFIVYIILGLYFILLGSHYIYLSLTTIIMFKKNNPLLRLYRPSLPKFFSIFLPMLIHEGIINVHDDSVNDNSYPFYIEVIIHTSSKGFGKIGHTDLCINNQIISYGNYDNRTYQMKEFLGDGVIFTCDKDNYIKFCLEQNKQTLFIYKVGLNTLQMNSLQHCLDYIQEISIPWKEDILQGTYLDRMQKFYTVKRYKVTKGKFKKFTVGLDNCTTFVQYVLASIGIDVLNITGITSPGRVLEYFEEQYIKKNSIVAERIILKNPSNANKCMNLSKKHTKSTVCLKLR